MNREENLTLYSIKFWAALAVIIIHSRLPGDVGIFVKNIARFAVPVFLVISGYFWTSPDFKWVDYQKRFIKREKKILQYSLYAIAIYFFFHLMINCWGNHLFLVSNALCNPKNWLHFFLFNYTTSFLGVGHLWYILALIYIYVIVFFVEKFRLWKLAYKVSIILILVAFVLEYVNFCTQMSFPGYFYRNWLFMGFPLFVFGRYIRENEVLMRKFNILVLLSLYLISIVLESFVFADVFDLLLSSLIACLMLMKLSCERKYVNFLSYYGKNYSQWIYIYHYIFIIVFEKIFSEKIKGNSFFLSWMFPLGVLISTIIFYSIIKKLCNLLLHLQFYKKNE